MTVNIGKVEVSPRHIGRWLKFYEISTEVNGVMGKKYELVSRKDKTLIEGNITPDAVVVIAFTDDKKLVVVREYRYALGGYIWGLPAGCLDEGQTIFQCAQNELYQETSMIVEEKDVMNIRNFTFPSAGMTDEMIAMVFCRAKGTPRSGNESASEIIEPGLMGLEQLRALRNSDDYISSRLAMMIEMICLFDDAHETARLII